MTEPEYTFRPDSGFTFRIAEHRLRPGRQVVLVYLRDALVATIAPEDDGSLKLVSPHVAQHWCDDGEGFRPPIPTHHFLFKPRPYKIVGDRIEYLDPS